ncbi:hypothetical protein PFISCL1PPCAC_25992, partial [Pristionchus fissidentatus]
LISSTALLHISTDDSFNYELALSNDRKSLEIKQFLIGNDSDLEVSLSRKEEVIASLTIPAKIVDGKHVIRIDSFYSVVFEAEAETWHADVEVFEDISTTKEKFFMQLKLRARDALIPEREIIYSEILKIGSTELPVSKELLAIQSEFFTTFFYSPFLDKDKEVKEIKDVAETKFVEFLQSLHRRKFGFTSVKNALDALGFADRFIVPDVSAKVLPYLTDKSLSEEMFEYALISADRVHKNEEILAWIISQFPSKSKVLEVLHAILPHISATTAQICLEPGMNELEE